MNFLIAIFILSIPLSYIQIDEIRGIFLQIVAGVAIFLIGSIQKLRIYFTNEALVLVLLCCLIFLYSLSSGNFRVLLAAFVFFLFFFVTIQLSGAVVERVLSLYKVGVVFSAVGVLVQISIFIFFGIDVLKVQQFGGGRNAFGFIWEDYSFLSLYLASAIPLFYSGKFNLEFFFSAALFLLASVATSARTGVVSLMLFLVIIGSISAVRIFVLGKIRKELLIFVLAIVIIPFVAIISLEGMVGREASFSSSGRIDDFVLGFNYFLKSPFFGVFFDDEYYINNISTIPHNLFVYTLYMGGVVALFLLIVLLFFFSFKMKRMDRRISASLMICFLGLQFIPSFFSAYFISILMGVGVMSIKNAICNKQIYK